MKSLPEQQRIIVTDLKEEEANLKNTVDQVNRILDWLYSLIDGRLVVGEQVRAKFYKITAYDPALLPLILSKPFDTNGVLVAKVHQTGNARSPVGSAVSVGWVEDGGNIRVQELHGLTSGTKYDLTFMVI